MNIVNVVNFIRSDDYRTTDVVLKEAVVKQMELAKKYRFPITFLFQHNALIKKDYVELVEREDYVEIGLWLELDRDAIERAGSVWKGEDDKSWEWFSHIDLIIGYTPDERRRIIDVIMSDFKNVFGFYPKTVGSWAIDAVSLAYLEEKYGVVASLNCKDQYFTDGYSLWGGYYNQAYYPCKNNAFCPAQSKNEQINIPIFRMLGSDPIKQYSCGIENENGQGVISLEPVYPESGGSSEWVEWFFEQMLKNEPLTFGYAQAGQENAFGWERMKEGYEFQMQFLDQMNREGKISLMKMHEAGEFYKRNYSLTPPSVNEAKNADGQHVLWYSSKNYRACVYCDENGIFIRDIMVFDEEYKERYLSNECKIKDSFYDNLPLVDNYRWSKNNCRPGLHFYKGDKDIGISQDFVSKKINNNSVELEFMADSQPVRICFYEDKLIIYGCDIGWVFGNNQQTKLSFENDHIILEYNDFVRKIMITGKVDSSKSMVYGELSGVILDFKK